MTAKRKPIAKPEIPGSHLEAMQAAGFEALSWHNFSILVVGSDGVQRQEWAPRNLVNWTTKQFIEYREADQGNYDFDGWEPVSGHNSGGRYRTVQGALCWIEWIKAQS